MHGNASFLKQRQRLSGGGWHSRWAPDNIPVKSSQTLPFLLIFQASGKFLYHFRFPFETIFFQTFKKRYILSMLSK
ncbi:uncharacterized protein Dvar_83930 [Desulfosarcina variabilis str. Montpellier]